MPGNPLRDIHEKVNQPSRPQGRGLSHGYGCHVGLKIVECSVQGAGIQKQEEVG